MVPLQALFAAVVVSCVSDPPLYFLCLFCFEEVGWEKMKWGKKLGGHTVSVFSKDIPIAGHIQSKRDDLM